MNKKVKTLIKIGFSILILVLLFSFFDFSKVDYKNITITPMTGVIMFSLLICSILVRAWRWKILINEKIENTEDKLSFLFSLKFLLIGSTLNIVLPAGSGDIAKSYFAYKEGGNKENMFVASIYDKVVAVASMFFLAIYAFFHTTNYWILLAGIIACSPWLLVHTLPYFEKINFFNKFILFINNKIKKMDLISFLKGFSFSFPTIFFSFILSILGWILTYLLLYYCFYISGLTKISINEVISFSPFLTLGRLFPLTFNGIGSDEAIITFLFKNHNAQLILLGSIIYRLILIIIPAILGLFFLNKKTK